MDLMTGMTVTVTMTSSMIIKDMICRTIKIIRAIWNSRRMPPMKPAGRVKKNGGLYHLSYPALACNSFSECIHFISQLPERSSCRTRS